MLNFYVFVDANKSQGKSIATMFDGLLFCCAFLLQHGKLCSINYLKKIKKFT